MTSGRDLKVGKKAIEISSIIQNTLQLLSELVSNPDNGTHENQREVKIPNHSHVSGSPSLTLAITATSAPPRWNKQVNTRDENHVVGVSLYQSTRSPQQQQPYIYFNL
ncbi:hypothetical protein Pmani_039430 [Petrolisthes manimaculis]|uniref:Uncharacterized protein n=1 Tax=Petrolisthes manimaculis TaxID=1843537 RepID=A0AAE1NE60_9EUCA|nr:hypothetical protein Pmani_039430 [Petrolisthes manimaculis]